ncbi:hypothetical protein SAY87_000216 [Trapa incisa]|uniref:Uncharacterized protein n=1 Tax=Trapa incisa TaxID=236973 RepID=A0AAN7GGD0_9MYRT|nr:hypothetical protein SAY87_000216 [Trapa incisa]
MDAADLSAYLVDVTRSYEAQEDIQLMKFADYFGRAFSSVGAAQFPWVKTFKESPVTKLVDISLSHVPEDVYKISMEWLQTKSPESLLTFAFNLLDSILSELASHLGSVKGSKKAVHTAAAKSQVAVFTILSMALQRKPEVLVSMLPTLKGTSKHQGQDRLPVNMDGLSGFSGRSGCGFVHLGSISLGNALYKVRQ